MANLKKREAEIIVIPDAGVQVTEAIQGCPDASQPGVQFPRPAPRKLTNAVWGTVIEYVGEPQPIASTLKGEK